MRTNRAGVGGRHARSLAVILGLVLAAVGSCGVAAGEAGVSARHLVKPAGMIIPINAFYGSMLGQNAARGPFRVERVVVSARQLIRSGACVYNSSDIPLSPAERVADTPQGESDTYCAPERGGHTIHSRIPRSKLETNPSMDFQPLLDKLGVQAATSVGLSALSYGTTLSIKVELDRAHHSGIAELSYGRRSETTSARQLKKLRFVAGPSGEKVSEGWY
jgi:hypothetical protein